VPGIQKRHFSFPWREIGFNLVGLTELVNNVIRGEVSFYLNLGLEQSVVRSSTNFFSGTLSFVVVEIGMDLRRL
jgi:hypothetical protein